MAATFNDSVDEHIVLVIQLSCLYDLSNDALRVVSVCALYLLLHVRSAWRRPAYWKRANSALQCITNFCKRLWGRSIVLVLFTKVEKKRASWSCEGSWNVTVSDVKHWMTHILRMKKKSNMLHNTIAAANLSEMSKWHQIGLIQSWNYKIS